MNYKLPLADPPIKAFHHHAFYLSTLLADKSRLPLFYNGYILLRYFENNDIPFDIVPFPNQTPTGRAPYLECCDFTFRNSLDYFDSSDPLEYIVNLNIQMLKKQFCIMGDFDEYFDPNKEVFNKHHFLHNYMLTGVCEEEQFFYSYGYNISNQSYRKYGEFKIKFNEYKNAIDLKPSSFPHFDDLWRELTYVNIKNSNVYIGKNIDIAEIKKQLYMFIYANQGTYDGINAILTLTKNLTKRFELQPLRLIMEHAKIMYDRAKYLYDNGFIEYDKELFLMLENVVTIATRQFLLSIKHYLSKDQAIIKNIQQTLYLLVENETKTFLRFLKAL